MNVILYLGLTNHVTLLMQQSSIAILILLYQMVVLMFDLHLLTCTGTFVFCRLALVNISYSYACCMIESYNSCGNILDFKRQLLDDIDASVLLNYHL